ELRGVAHRRAAAREDARTGRDCLRVIERRLHAAESVRALALRFAPSDARLGDACERSALDAHPARAPHRAGSWRAAGAARRPIIIDAELARGTVGIDRADRSRLAAVARGADLARRASAAAGAASPPTYARVRANTLHVRASVVRRAGDDRRASH